MHAWAREHAGGVPGLRLVELASLHVTLCFLGSRAVTEVGKIAGACRAVAGLAAPDLTIGEALWLPPRRPRVLTVELADAAGRLGAVQSVLSDALVAGGFYEPEARPFLAHVTVARAGATPASALRSSPHPSRPASAPTRSRCFGHAWAKAPRATRPWRA